MTIIPRRWMLPAATALACVAAVSAASAQTPAADPSTQLRAVLPPDVADHVLAQIADARARQLPAAALEHRAAELAAKGAPGGVIDAAVTDLARGLAAGSDALARGGHAPASDAETEAAAAALTSGADGAAVSALARSAPSGRSLAVPLYVLSGLMDRGLPSDQALARVQAGLAARLSDRQLESGAEHAANAPGRPETTGRDLAATHQPVSTGRPGTLPANGGAATRPTMPAAAGSHPHGRP